MAKNVKIGVKMKVLRGPRTSEVGVIVAQIGFGRHRRWKLRFADNFIANFHARSLQRVAAITTASEKPVIFTVAGTPLAEQRSAEPPDDDDIEANSEEQSEEESDASTGASEDDEAENQAPLVRSAIFD